MTLYGNLECDRAKSGRRDLMGSQCVARPSLERGLEAASGKKRTPQHEDVTDRTKRNGSKPPYNVPHTPLGIRRASCFLLLLKRRKCIRGHFFGFWHPQWSFARFFRIRRGIRRHPRVHWQICASKWLLFRTLPCDVAT